MTCPGRLGLEERVLEQLRPTPLQLRLLSRLYATVKGKLEECLKAKNLEAVVESQGSYAKGTLLSDKWELDVFVLFKGVGDEWVEKEALGALSECLRGVPIVVKYAQHPYLTVSLMGMEADVVPAVWVERPRPSGMGVERTPFHTRYVKSKLERQPCLADDVRLLKGFLKGIGAYGAETHVGGFSGYLAELLVLAYGGFRGVLEAAATWKPPVYVDPEGVGSEERLRRRYPDSPLIVVDPVDPSRNAAAAVRPDKLALFTLAARLYLNSPSEEFFHATRRRVHPYRPEPGRLAVLLYRGRLYMHPPEAVWGRLYRASRLLAAKLAEEGFTVAGRWFDTDESSYGVVVVEVLEEVLPPLRLAEGPEAWEPVRAERFSLKRAAERMPVWFSDDGRLLGLRPRKRRLLRDAVAAAASSIPSPPGAVLVHAGTLEGVGEPWRAWILEGYRRSLPSWIASLPEALER